MPLYEFKCSACDEVFDVRQDWKAPYPDCPACGGGDVKKVYHPAALVFKGSGWHVNDYGKSGPNGSSKNGSSKSSSESTTEKKDAPKVEAAAGTDKGTAKADP